MKKILLCLFFGLMAFANINAQTYYYRTTAFAMKELTSYGTWGSWSDWENSNMLISIDYTNDIVEIFSPKKQVYKITQHVNNYFDSSNGRQAEFRFIDQDGDTGTMRLRVDSNNNSQIYIDFANLMWVYNLVKIR